MTVASTHPDPGLLKSYGLGLLGPVESAEVEQHINSCDACCHTLESLADDSLVALLRPGTAPLAGDSPGAPEGCRMPAELAGHPRYRVVELLGRGGMGTVYKAEHLVMERPVALKVIRRGLLDRPAAVARFGREVKVAARLSHPNIVRAYDAESAGDTHFLVMEFVAGESLARVVAGQGPLPVARACEYTRQAALGLQHAFEHGTVHRDIKPQNLILTTEGQVKILDFGLARFLSESPPADPVSGTSAAGSAGPDEANTPSGTLTDVRVVMGSADYIAPEQIADAHAADIRADIYSLGCTLYHLLTDHPPFSQREDAEKLQAHLEQVPKPITELREDVPRVLARVVERMMAKEPAQRYQTPAEVAQALAPFAGAGRVRRRWGVPIAIVGLLVLLGLLAYVFSPVVSRFVSNKGQFVLETDDPDALVIAFHQGNRVAAISPRDGRVGLPAAKYHLQLVSGRRDLELTPARLTLGRAGRQVVTVRSIPGFVGEVRRLEGHSGWVTSVAISPDGRRALSGSHDKTIRLWDLERGTELRRLEGHSTLVWGVAFSPDGRYALSGSGGEYKDSKWGEGTDNTVRLWDLDSGREVRCLKGHTAWVRSVTFLPDGRHAISASTDKSVRLWDVETGREVRSFLGHDGGPMCLAVSPDGRRVLSGDTVGALILWDVDTGREIRRLIGHSSNYVLCAASSPDGRRALSGGWDATLRLWDVETGKQLNQFDHVGHHVLGVAFCPDNRRAVWVSNGGTLRLWDVIAWKELCQFNGHTDFVSAVAVSRDGRRAVSGSKDQTVRLWALPPSD